MDIIVFLGMFFLLPISVVFIYYIMFLKNKNDTMYIERLVVFKIKKSNKNIDLMVDELAKSMRKYILFPQNIIVVDAIEQDDSSKLLKKICEHKGYIYLKNEIELCKYV